MTPEELKRIAMNASKLDVDKIETQLLAAAKKGNLSCVFKGLSEGVVQHLRDKGFNIEEGLTNNIGMVSNAEKEYTVIFK